MEGAAGARVTFQVIQVTFNKNPIIVGVSKAETVTATVVPAGVVDEVKFRIDDETIANLDQDRIAASPGTLTLTGLARGTTTLRAEILTDLGSETCGSVVVKGGKIDFMRITPDPGILTPSEQTTFTAIGFAQVKDFPFLPHEFSPDLATAVGTEITVGASKGIFLGPVPVSWILSGGAAAEAFIPTGVPTVEVPSVVVEATSTAVGEIVPDLVCHGIGKEDKADLKVLVRVAFAANPIITGFSFPATKSSLGKEIGVLVQPPHAVDQIKFVRAGDQPTRVEVFEIEKNKGTGLIRLRVEGRSATPADMPGGDTEILAMLGEKVLRTAKVIVVVPTIQKHDVSSGYVLQNTAKPAGGGKTNVKSIAGTIVKISIFDQFGKLLDSVYNGQGVVTELFKDFHPPGVAEKSFPAGELAISFPDAKFENGIKLDLSSSTLSANIDGVMTGNEIKQWEQKLFFIAGNNNTFSLLLTQDQTVAATQEIRVHNHLMTPDFRRTIVDKDANFPPVPFEVRDVAK